MSSNDKYRERAAELLALELPCTCDVAYTSHEMAALDCPRCNYADDLAEAIAALCSQVERETLERAGIRWFSVDDRLPGAPPRLALAVERGKVRIRNTIEIHQIAEIIGVTHWAEMPPLPAAHTEGK
jgi:hypothetical protein